LYYTKIRGERSFHPNIIQWFLFSKQFKERLQRLKLHRRSPDNTGGIFPIADRQNKKESKEEVI